MKQTKTFAAILSAAVLALSAIAFAACNTPEEAVGATVKASEEKLLVLEGTKTGGSLEDALSALQEAELLTYSGSTGEFGLFLETVNGYKADTSKNEYWALYTSLGEYEGVSYSNAEYGTFEYGGKSYASASYGVSGLPMVAGELYILTLETY